MHGQGQVGWGGQVEAECEGGQHHEHPGHGDRGQDGGGPRHGHQDDAGPCPGAAGEGDQ